MISIIEDTSALVSLETATYIANASDYVHQYKVIKNALACDNNLVVVVREAIIVTWIKKLSLRYNEQDFHFTTANYRSQLESLWGIQIPNDYTDEEIKELNLANLETYPKHNDQFDDFILAYYYDTVYANASFAPVMIVPLVIAFDKDKWEYNQRFKLLNKIYDTRIKNWWMRIKDNALAMIYQRVVNDPVGFELDLMKYKILRTPLYHKIGEIEFRELFNCLQNLKLSLKDIEIDLSIIKSTLNQIEVQLNTIPVPSNRQELEAIINQLSGLLPLEYDLIENHIYKNPKLVTKATVNQIRTTFAPIYKKLNRRIEGLLNLIVPDKPIVLPIDSEISFVKDWLLNSYLPYNSWLVNSGTFDPDIITIGDSFSEWYYTNWEDLRANSGILVSNWLYKISQHIKNDMRVNIVLIIDNFSFTYTKYIKAYFEENDYSVANIEPYFSMIPSETETSKKCLLSGKSNYNEIDQSSYSNILNKGWLPYFDSERFIYMPSYEHFEKSDIQLGKTYFINYHAIDVALHQDKSKLGLVHEKHISNLLKELVNQLVQKIDETDLSQAVSIHIISDHGSTKLHANNKNEIDVKQFKQKESVRVSERFMFLDDENFTKIPDNYKYDCFMLEKERFGLASNCLIARRANAFRDYSNESYLHGGILPEEIVVPYIQFDKSLIKLEKLIVNLLKHTYRCRTENIELQIENPNSFAIENLHIKIHNSNIISSPGSLEWLDKKSRIEIKIPSRIKKSLQPKENESLMLSITYLVKGKLESIDYNLDIKIISMIEMKDNSVFEI